MQEQTSRSLLLSGSILAGIGVALGAFGAHGLKSMVSSEMLSTFETAVRYQMYHSFGLVFAGLACRSSPTDVSPRFRLVGWLFAIGVALFCGSLYLLVLMNIPWLGAVTPFGGVSFIAGWVVLVLTFSKGK